jgi:hypothetical protein
LETFSLERRNKLVIGALMVAILALMLVLLQQQFNQGDYRRAVELLAARQPGTSWSIGQELLERSKRGPPDCRPKLVSSLKGTLEVTCDTGDGRTYQFEVDLVRQSVRPLNAEAREVIEAVSTKTRGLDAGGLPASQPQPYSDGGR